MKTITTTTENNFCELLTLNLTEAQKTLMCSHENSEEKKALIKTINAQRICVLTAAETAIIQAKYNEIKPVIKAGQVYSFIGLDGRLDGEIFSGILNCRVNGEHLQIRF